MPSLSMAKFLTVALAFAAQVQAAVNSQAPIKGSMSDPRIAQFFADPPPPKTLPQNPSPQPSPPFDIDGPTGGTSSRNPKKPFTPRPQDDINSGLCPYVRTIKWEPEKPQADLAVLPEQVPDRGERCWNFEPAGNAQRLGIYNWFTSHWDSNQCYTCYCYVAQGCTGEVSQKLAKFSPLFRRDAGWQLPASGPCGSVSCPAMPGCKTKGCAVEENLDDFAR
jgi:hypothetical protein